MEKDFILPMPVSDAGSAGDYVRSNVFVQGILSQFSRIIAYTAVCVMRIVRWALWKRKGRNKKIILWNDVIKWSFLACFFRQNFV